GSAPSRTRSARTAPSSARPTASRRRPPETSQRLAMPADALLGAPLNVVTAGPELFSAAVAAQGVAVTRVDWQPPASVTGLASLWCATVDAAHRLALHRRPGP